MCTCDTEPLASGSRCALDRILIYGARRPFHSPNTGHMSARLVSTTSEEVELVMMEEVEVASRNKSGYAKKVRIYHQMKALVSSLTLPLTSCSCLCRLSHNIVTRANGTYNIAGCDSLYSCVLDKQLYACVH